VLPTLPPSLPPCPALPALPPSLPPYRVLLLAQGERGQATAQAQEESRGGAHPPSSSSSSSSFFRWTRDER